MTKATMIMIGRRICLLVKMRDKRGKVVGMYPKRITKKEVERRILRGETIRGLTEVQQRNIEEWRRYKKLSPAEKRNLTKKGKKPYLWK